MSSLSYLNGIPIRTKNNYFWLLRIKKTNFLQPVRSSDNSATLSAKNTGDVDLTTEF
jgi:hypothetical protein